MNQLQRELSQMSGAQVADLATRYGDFAITLADNLKSYGEIIGVDLNAEAVETARKRHSKKKNVSFVTGNACGTWFEDERFDIVAISNSLHHIEAQDALFKEMKRLVKKGGYLIISEMTADCQEGPAKSHAMLHAWDGHLDTALGIYHAPTCTRAELSKLMTEHSLVIQKEFLVENSNPQNIPGIKKRIDAMEDKLKKAEGLVAYPMLKEEMEDVQAYYEKNDAAFATVDVLICQK